MKYSTKGWTRVTGLFRSADGKFYSGETKDKETVFLVSKNKYYDPDEEGGYKFILWSKKSTKTKRQKKVEEDELDLS